MSGVLRTLTGVSITGVGGALPDRVVTNLNAAARLDTTAGWIEERSGVLERRVGGTTSGLAVRACRAALRAAELEAGDVGLLILATASPDLSVPATACTVQHELGLRCGALDVHAACTGFIYALVLAASVVATGGGPVLVVGAETLSRIVDPKDRTLAVLVGDGAGAVVIESTPGDGAVLASDLGSDGSATHVLKAEVGGFLHMEGPELFRRAVRAMAGSVSNVLERSGIPAADVALLVPHQANRRIIDAACQRLAIAPERVAVVLDRTGNTSSASIPLALADALSRAPIPTGAPVVLTGFGGGMTWGSVVLEWGSRSSRVTPLELPPVAGLAGAQR